MNSVIFNFEISTHARFAIHITRVLFNLQ